ncbi:MULTISPECIES: acyl carrier protein [Actinoallomurus]|uniref:acyl carrier protein n=1 Tax=Actinoallomurus TaxID=667113 RepID=UPI0020935419|nr:MULTISPECIES: acyl carrier protein [Actinoallomurus]MCO5968354.1 acyl carrier protein [Actinoallomurus soli]MCO5995876.1 acyl carrier protein [Actinoallomurus rhizosphaericola]
MVERAVALDEPLRAEIKDIVCDILKTSPDNVTLNSRFIEDHGADSLQYVDVLASIERVCGVLIDPEEMVRMTTLAGIYAVIEEAL